MTRETCDVADMSSDKLVTCRDIVMVTRHVAKNGCSPTRHDADISNYGEELGELVNLHPIDPALHGT